MIIIIIIIISSASNSLTKSSANRIGQALAGVHQAGGRLDDVIYEGDVLHAGAQLRTVASISSSSVGQTAGQLGVVHLQGFLRLQANLLQLLLQVGICGHRLEDGIIQCFVVDIGGLLDDAADDAKVLNADAQLGSSISSVGLAAGQFGVVRLQGFKCFQADFVQLFLQIRVADYKKASQVSVYTPVTIL
ncbi:hypothetical protein TYRP_001544 [Tyrophagus putrescentiae]|nr:hypothetical protein TYRP_001544 [Tyrophagus putrescentiae]